MMIGSTSFANHASSQDTGTVPDTIVPEAIILDVNEAVVAAAITMQRHRRRIMAQRPAQAANLAACCTSTRRAGELSH